MKKRIIAIIGIVLLLALLIPAGVVNAAGITVTDTSTQVSFPASIVFNIAAQSGSNIDDIRMYYTVDRTDFATIVSEEYIAFNPAKSVKTQYLMDMRMTGGFPPGTILHYWWVLKDASGATLQTDSQSVQFDDGRYSWKSLQQGKVTLYWYNGSNSFGQELMDATQSALGRLDENTGAQLKTPVRLYIYANSTDLQGSMIYSNEWTGGRAFPQYGVVAIGIATDSASVTWGKSTISHELTHLVNYQVTANPYNGLPTWLDEGLAMYAEGPLDSQFSNPLSTAEQNHTLITVRSLTSPFSAFTDVAVLSYAESYSIVSFLIGKYGRDKMLELLDMFPQGTSYDNALQTVYGFTMEGLNTAWQASLFPASVN